MYYIILATGYNFCLFHCLCVCVYFIFTSSLEVKSCHFMVCLTYFFPLPPSLPPSSSSWQDRGSSSRHENGCHSSPDGTLQTFLRQQTTQTRRNLDAHKDGATRRGCPRVRHHPGPAHHQCHRRWQQHIVNSCQWRKIKISLFIVAKILLISSQEGKTFSGSQVGEVRREASRKQ